MGQDYKYVPFEPSNKKLTLTEKLYKLLGLSDEPKPEVPKKEEPTKPVPSNPRYSSGIEDLNDLEKEVTSQSDPATGSRDIHNYKFNPPTPPAPKDAPSSDLGLANPAILNPMRVATATGVRTAGPWAGGALAGLYSSGMAIPAGKFAGGTAADLLAQAIEPGDHPLNYKRAAVSGALGTIPMPGGPIRSGLAGAATGYLGTAGYKAADGVPLNEAVDPRTWTKTDIALGPALGGALGTGLSYLFPHAPKAPPSATPPPNPYKGKAGLRVALDDLKKVPLNDTTVTAETLAKHKALAAEQARDPKGPIPSEIGLPLIKTGFDAKGDPIWKPPSLRDVEKLHTEANKGVSKDIVDAAKAETAASKLTTNEAAAEVKLQADTEAEALRARKETIRDINEKSKALGDLDKNEANVDKAARRMAGDHERALAEDAKRTEQGIAQAAAEQQASELDALKGTLTETHDPSVISETITGPGEHGGKSRATFSRTAPEKPTNQVPTDKGSPIEPPTGGRPDDGWTKETVENHKFETELKARAAGNEVGLRGRPHKSGRGKFYFIFDDPNGNPGEPPASTPTKPKGPKTTSPDSGGEPTLTRGEVTKTYGKNEATILAKAARGVPRQVSPKKWVVDFPEDRVVPPVHEPSEPTPIQKWDNGEPPPPSKVAPYVPDEAGSSVPPTQTGDLTPDEFRRYMDIRPGTGVRRTPAELAEYRTLHDRINAKAKVVPEISDYTGGQPEHTIEAPPPLSKSSDATSQERIIQAEAKMARKKPVKEGDTVTFRGKDVNGKPIIGKYVGTPELNPRNALVETPEGTYEVAREELTAASAPSGDLSLANDSPLTVDEFAGALSKEGEKPIAKVPFQSGKIKGSSLPEPTTTDMFGDKPREDANNLFTKMAEPELTTPNENQSLLGMEPAPNEPSFGEYKGDAGQFFTLSDEQAGYPKTREALASYDDSRLKDARHQSIKDSFDKVFGHNAKKFLKLIEDEMESRGINTGKPGQAATRPYNAKPKPEPPPEAAAQVAKPVNPTKPAPQSGAIPVKLFKSKLEAVRESYPATQAAEKAGEIPKNDPHYSKDTRGRPVTPARMQGGEISRLNKDEVLRLAEKVKKESGGPTFDDLAKLSPEEQEKSIRADVQKWLESKRNQKGEIDPALLVRLGMGAGGAAIGAATDDEHPVRGAIVGGLAGLGAGYVASKVPSIARGEQTLKEAVEPVASRVPNYFRGSLLSDPRSIFHNSVAGPWGSNFWGGLEETLKGVANQEPAQYEAGRDTLKTALNPVKWMKGFSDSLGEASQRIHDVDDMGRSGQFINPENPNIFDRAVEQPAVAMLAGDLNTRNIMSEAGMNEHTIRKLTNTAEPSRAYTKNLSNFGKAVSGQGETGQPSNLIAAMLPFKRTSANIVENGVERMPGVGSLVNYLGDPDLKVGWKDQAVQQLIGTAQGAMGYEIGVNTDKDTNAKFKIHSLTSNLGGQGALLASIGFMIGQAVRDGKPIDKAAIQEFVNAMPLPTAEPITDAATLARKVVTGQPIAERDVPSMLVPKILPFMMKDLPNMLGASETGRPTREPRNQEYTYRPFVPKR